MSKEVLQAIKAICDEKHIPVESVLSTIEQALAAAYRKDFGNRMQNLKVDFNPETMGIRVYDVKTVVEDQELDEEGNVVGEIGEIAEGAGAQPAEEKKDADPSAEFTPSIPEGPAEAAEDEEERFNPKTQIMIREAKEIKPDVELGEELVQELTTPGEFGRMAAQTAKQVIIQRLREAEREVVFNEYKDKEGTLVNGAIQRIEAGNVLVDIGQATAIMPPQEQVRSEHYSPGSQLRFLIKSVATSNRGPEVIVSRASRDLVHRLFEMEVPEIADGSVVLKAIAREPGSRSKIAVATEAENVDPVGSCVGQRGTRVQFIINELGGEKIDIIEWDADEIQFIKNALSPAKVVDVALHAEARSAEAFVADDQFSLAIGKQGQNVRLASSLTGFRIDIKPLPGSAAAAPGDGAEKKEESKEEPKQEDSSAPEAAEAAPASDT